LHDLWLFLVESREHAVVLTCKPARQETGFVGHVPSRCGIFSAPAEKRASVVPVFSKDGCVILEESDQPARVCSLEE
jgi:hypothetical protein